MKTPHTLIFLSALLFLFFLQQITFLVESIYMLNLLNTSMDLRALGILFLLLPALLFFIRTPGRSIYLTLGMIVISSALISPLVATSYRIFSAGIGSGIFLLYLGLQLSDDKLSGYSWGVGVALAALISVALRALGSTLDLSVTGDTKFIGWLVMALAVRLLFVVYSDQDQGRRVDDAMDIETNKNPLLNVMAIAGSIILIYFTFSSPGVIARWTGASYGAINIVFSMALLSWVLVRQFRHGPHITSRVFLIGWNVIFLMVLLLVIVLNTIRMPATPEAEPGVVHNSSALAHVAAYLMVLLSPVIFENLSIYMSRLKVGKPSDLALSFLLASLFITMSVFMLIFTNVWGYVGEVSRIFRNRFFLPFAIAGLAMILPLVVGDWSSTIILGKGMKAIRSREVIVMAISMCVLSMVGIYLNRPVRGGDVLENGKLTMMTYNIQQGVDLFGNKNYEGQLGLIRRVDPDILCLQESDAARISGGNSDIVRYFENHLNYYSYYGPKTVTGTYGTAILSRFPLKDCRTVFTYSDKDEVGTAIAIVSVGKRSVTVANSHPAGGQACRQAHIAMLAKAAEQNRPFVAMGDYNFRQDSPYYKTITSVLDDAWLAVYPDAIGQVEKGMVLQEINAEKKSSGMILSGNRIDMRERIDHIFLSDDFEVIEAHFLPTPESQTDHPAHWVVVRMR